MMAEEGAEQGGVVAPSGEPPRDPSGETWPMPPMPPAEGGGCRAEDAEELGKLTAVFSEPFETASVVDRGENVERHTITANPALACHPHLSVEMLCWGCYRDSHAPEPAVQGSAGLDAVFGSISHIGNVLQAEDDVEAERGDESDSGDSEGSGGSAAAWAIPVATQGAEYAVCLPQECGVFGAVKGSDGYGTMQFHTITMLNQYRAHQHVSLEMLHWEEHCLQHGVGEKAPGTLICEVSQNFPKAADDIPAMPQAKKKRGKARR